VPKEASEVFMRSITLEEGRGPTICCRGEEWECNWFMKGGGENTVKKKNNFSIEWNLIGSRSRGGVGGG